MDCLDHILILGERHLLRVLTLYSVYYNQAHAHLGLDKDTPLQQLFNELGPSSRCLSYLDWSSLYADMIFGKDGLMTSLR
jgi:hypothetical protein